MKYSDKNKACALRDPFLDGRVKLIPCKVEMVKYWHSTGMPIRHIANIFKVTDAAIRFIIKPEIKKTYKQCLEKRGGYSKNYYHRIYHTEQVKEYRNKKRKLWDLILS